MQPVDHLFCGTNEIFHQKWLGDEVLCPVDERPEALLDIRPAGHEQEWDVASRITGTKLFEELAAIQSGHVVVAEDNVGGLIDDFEKRISAIRGDRDFT